MTIGIAAEEIRHRYKDHVAVDGVSFSVTCGEVFGLLGPNGAGKTTILRVLAGILRPSEGRGRILGHDVTKEPRIAKRELGFLSGDTALYARLTVREILRYFGRLHVLEKAVLEARIERVSEDLGLAEFIDHRVGALSSGQKQRANLARAFLTDPPVLILDEPTVGLDVISGRFVVEAIDRARSAGKAVLFSTHIMSEVEELCDRVGLLLAGRLRAVGTARELLEGSGKRSLGELIVHLHQEGR
jgi:sodium transport system ATP-binding protein